MTVLLIAVLPLLHQKEWNLNPLLVHFIIIIIIIIKLTDGSVVRIEIMNDLNKYKSTDSLN